MLYPNLGLTIDRARGLLLVIALAYGLGGCGQDLTGVQQNGDRWSHDIWFPTGAPDQPTPQSDTAIGSAPPENLPLTLVRGEFVLRHGVDGLYVSMTEIDFGATGEVQVLVFGNLTGTTIHCRAGLDVDWATVFPAEFRNAGELNDLLLTVRRTGLQGGEYQGELTITADNGSVLRIPLRMTVVASPNNPAVLTPQLEVSTAFLDLGPNGTSGTFVLRNVGAGRASFEVVGGDEWISVKPRSGAVEDRPVTIQVVADLRSLLVGQHTTSVIVNSDGQAGHQVGIALTKLPLSPLIVPWKHVSTQHTQAELDDVIAALHKWQRVTDTACIITGPGQSGMFQELRARLPGMQIIPALSTSSWLRYAGFDSVTQWRALGAEAAAVAAACGQNRVVLENEAAVQPYILGQYPLNEQRMRECLRQLPPDLEYIWYPALYFNPDYPDQLARSEALCRWVEQELDCRFVDASLGDPYWWTPNYVAGRALLESFAEKPTMPAIWFGCSISSWCYWQYEQACEMMQAVSGRPDLLLYPIVWPGSADELVPRLVTLYPAAP